MKVTKNITIDLNNPRRQVVHLMAGDNQREITLTLLKDGMPFDVSEGIGTATLVKGVGYIKANGVGGYYDWTSTDEAAVALVTNTTNKWTVRLDEHATDVPGFAQIFVKFSLASGETLYAFPIALDVIRTSGGSTDPDKPYYHSTSFLLAGAQAEKTPSMTTPIGVDSSGKLWVASADGLTDGAKNALLALLAKVAYIDTDGQDLYDALESELFPPAELDHIVADYVQETTIYNTDSLDKIKDGDELIVTAYYTDGTHEDLVDSAYTLSGTLVAPSSVITVSYGGKTDTITVVVTSIPYTHRWNFKESLEDTIGNVAFTIGTVNNGTAVRNSNGLVFTGDGSHAFSASATTPSGELSFSNTLTKIKFGAMSADLSHNGGTKGSTYGFGNGCVFYAPAHLMWRGSSDKFSGNPGGTWQDNYYTTVGPNYFSEKTLEIYIYADGSAEMKCENTTIATFPASTYSAVSRFVFGNVSSQTFCDMTIEEITIEPIEAST